MPVSGKNATFDLTCDVIGWTEVNEIKSQGTSLVGLSNTVWILKIGRWLSEILVGGGYGWQGSLIALRGAG